MTKASGRPLIGPRRRDRGSGKAWVATRVCKRSYGLLSRLDKSQTNVWELDRASRHHTRPLSPAVSRPGVARARHPFAPPGLACVGGDLPQFFPQICWDL